MKQIIGSICLALCCLGVAWVEYQIVTRVGGVLILFAVAAILGALSVALSRAPQGYERPDGFHVRTRDRRLSPIRPIRFFHPVRAREWRWRSGQPTHNRRHEPFQPWRICASRAD